MFQLLKKLLALIWNQKKFISFTLALALVFFVLRFPWNHLLEKTVRQLQKNSPSSFQMDFDKIQLKLFPPGIKFKNMLLNYKGKILPLESCAISMDITRWLAFKKAWKIQVSQEDSRLAVVFWQAKKALKDDPSDTPVQVYFVKGKSPLLNLKDLDAVFPDIKMAGKVRTDFDYEGQPEKIQFSKAFFNIEGEDIYLSKTEFKTPLGPLSLPSVQWKEASASFSLKEGELLFKNILLGSPEDQFIVRMRGSGSLFASYGRIGLNSYDIELQIDLDKNFKMNLLDLMFAGFKEDKGSFYRYSLRMTGQGNQIPNMEKLDEF